MHCNKERCRIEPAMIFWAIIVTVVANQVVSQQATDCKTSSGLEERTIVNETLKLISRGETNIALDDDKKNIVLVAGLTGAGKSTMSKFLTGKALQSYKKGTRYLISDTEGKIGNETIVSKTIFPDMYIDEKTGTIYYDLPGFSDTRSVSVELANALFMKKVADHAESVKIVFIVSFSELISGGSRNAFKTLLEHAVRFISEPSKFSRGIALVASKVPSGHEEEDILEDISGFLLEVKGSMAGVFADSGTVRKANDIINAFLTRSKDQGRYERIGYFQQPTRPGNLSSMPIIEERRSSLRDMIENRLEYVKKQDGDFAISISERAKYFTKILLEKLSVLCESLISGLASLLKVNIFGVDFVGKYLADVAELDALITELDATKMRTDFVGMLERNGLVARLPNETTQQLKALNKNMKFYEDIIGVSPQWKSLDWTQPFQVISSDLHIAATLRVRRLNDETESTLIQIAASFGRTLQANADSKNAESVSEKEAIRSNVQKDVQRLKAIIIDLKATETYNNFLTQFQTGIRGLVFEPTFQSIPVLKNDIILRTQTDLRTGAWVAHVETLQDKYELELIKCTLAIEEQKHQNVFVANSVRIAELELNLQQKVNEIASLNSKYVNKLRSYASAWQSYYDTLTENLRLP